MKTIQMNIPTMQSAHCQTRVSALLKQIQALDQLEVQAGQVKFELEDLSFQADIVAMIENAGYKVESVELVDATEDKIFQFKTNINCSGCVAKVTNALNDAEGICHWVVDTKQKDKILTVHSDGISESELIERVKKAGFNIEAV